MKLTIVKNVIKNNKVTNFAAESILDVLTVIRAGITGSYTKYKEDLIVKKIFADQYQQSPKEIQYIDIGANNYRRGNNSYLFYKEGMRGGVLVEADPFLCNRLKQKRKKDQVYNIAIGTEDSESIDFYVLSLPTRSTLDKEYVDKAIEAGLSIKEVIKIPCFTLNSLLEKLNYEPDYMSIDIEGMDYKVIRSIDFTKHPIKVIVAELCDERNEDGETMNEFMVRSGYQIYGQYGCNVIYVKKEQNNIVKIKKN